MNIRCPACQSILTLDENKYSKESLLIQCPKCLHKLRVALPKVQEAVLSSVGKAVHSHGTIEDSTGENLNNRVIKDVKVFILMITIWLIVLIITYFTIFDLLE